MKRYKKLIILAAVLCVAVGGYFIIRTVSKGEDSSNGILIYSEESKDIVSVSFDNSTESYTLEKDSEDKWNVSGETDFDIDSDAADGIITAFASLRATQKVSDDFTDKDKYGLGDGALVVSVKTSNDNDRTFRVGKLNENSSMYYFSCDSDSALYYIDSTLYKTLSLTKLDIVKRDEIPEVNTDDITAFTLKNGDFSVSLTPYLSENESESGASGYEISGSDTRLDKSDVEAMIKSVLNLSVDEPVCYKPDEAKLKEYSLDAPYGRYTIEYTKTGESKSFSAIISKADSDGNAFFMVSGSDKIYKIDSSQLDVYAVNSLSALSE